MTGESRACKSFCLCFFLIIYVSLSSTAAMTVAVTAASFTTENASVRANLKSKNSENGRLVVCERSRGDLKNLDVGPWTCFVYIIWSC